jgi:hypothetical protein
MGVAHTREEAQQDSGHLVGENRQLARFFGRRLPVSDSMPGRERPDAEKSTTIMFNQAHVSLCKELLVNY